MTGDEWVGQTIAGKYRVEALLGRGGMGLVLHARHLRLDEEVAIKLLLPAIRDVPGMTTRFVREAQAAAKIKSRHVVRVTDVDVLPDGTPYMIMEYLDGVSLGVLRRQRGALPIPTAVSMVLEACDAIGEAHAIGIVHRDLKPANLFLARGRDGQEIVKVLDFGISKIDAPGEQDTTRTGQMMGSPKYMSPEQMLSMHDVDGRGDIWSLGAILYDFVAGRTPFVADTTPQLCSLVLHGTPPPPRQFRADLPEALEAVILRCLERDPEKRFASVAELVAALAPFAPPGALIPAPRSPSSANLRRTGSLSGAGPLPQRAAGAPDDGEKPTEHVPMLPSLVHGAGDLHDGKSDAARAISPSGPPGSAHGATQSAWNSALHDRSSARRRPRTFALGAGAFVVLGAVAFAVLLGRRTAPAGATTADPVATVVPAATVPPPEPGPGLVPSLAPSVSPSAPPSSSSEPAASAPTPLPSPPSPRVPSRPAKKAVDPGASQADPFGGRRR